MTHRILVIDDEKEITDLVEIYLQQEGYLVTKRYDATTLVEDLAQVSFDLVILDIMMPIVDGIEALKMLRQNYNMPVIMLSAKSTDDDKINGLSIGADDYVTKPFNAKELVARVKSQLRRTHVFNKDHSVNPDIIEANDLIIDIKKKYVLVEQRPVALTRTEFEILLLLAKNPGVVYSTEDIFESIWNERSTNSHNTIMVHIRKLREKIELKPRTPRHVITVWGIGYKFER